METITFTSTENDKQHPNGGKGQLLEMTVKSEFAQKCPDYLTTDLIDLLKVYEIMNFWHNPNGPAVIDHKINVKTYMIDGKPVTDEEEKKKIMHREGFNKQMDTVLSDSVL